MLPFKGYHTLPDHPLKEQAVSEESFSADSIAFRWHII